MPDAHVQNVNPLDLIFRPRSVAIIGASTDPKKLGGLPIYFTKKRGYKGKLFPVNPGAAEVQGIPAFPNLKAIGEPVDCVVVAVPANLALKAMEDIAEARVPVAIVFTSGFAEVNEEGRLLQVKLLEIARQGGVRVVGPNSMGSYDLTSGFIAHFGSAFDHHNGQGWPRVAPLAIASQSGAVGSHLMVQLRERGIGLTKWISTGNQGDIDIAECIDYLAGDPDTQIIAAYLEGAPDGKRLVAALEKARRAKKPMVVLKVGASEAGAAAIATHTASLAGSDAAFDAVMKQHGVARARSLEEFADFTAAATTGLFPERPEAVIVSMSGGVAALMADAASATGLKLPPLPKGGQDTLKKIVSFAAVTNPIDTAAPGMADMGILARMMEVPLEHGYPAMVGFITHLPLTASLFDALKPKLVALRAKFPDRTIAFSCYTLPEHRAFFHENKFIAISDPWTTVAAVAALAQMRQALERAPAAAQPVPAAAPAPRDVGVGEVAAKQLLAALGIPVLPERLAKNAKAAADAAAALGLPAALKIASEDIPHKTEIGGVLLNVATPQAAAEGYDTLIARAKHAKPDARIDGVLVSPMLTGGVETILGLHRDAVVGPVVMFGIGGIFAEIYRDVAFLSPPFGKDDALKMIQSVRGWPLLAGARGRPKADVNAIADALVRLGAYAAKYGDQIESFDINPFVVRQEGKGAVALDALLIARNQTQQRH